MCDCKNNTDSLMDGYIPLSQVPGLADNSELTDAEVKQIITD